MLVKLTFFKSILRLDFNFNIIIRHIHINSIKKILFNNIINSIIKNDNYFYFNYSIILY